MLFDEEQFNNPIDFTEPPRNKRLRLFRQEFREIWEKLHDSGINMRPVFWSKEDKKSMKENKHRKYRFRICMVRL